jgi:hypothetical protein
MAKNKLKKRVRKELRRRQAQRHPLGPGQRSVSYEPWFPGDESDWPRGAGTIRTAAPAYASLDTRDRRCPRRRSSWTSRVRSTST